MWTQRRSEKPAAFEEVDALTAGTGLYIISDQRQNQGRVLTRPDL